jgi:hypothetical protein
MLDRLPGRYKHAIIVLNDRTWEPLTPDLVRRLNESMHCTARLDANFVCVYGSRVTSEQRGADVRAIAVGWLRCRIV